MQGNISSYQDLILVFNNLTNKWKEKCLLIELFSFWQLEKKNKHLNIAILLKKKKRFHVESRSFLLHIVAIDKMWVRVWISGTSIQSKKIQRAQSKVKIMTIFACNHYQGITTTNMEQEWQKMSIMIQYKNWLLDNILLLYIIAHHHIGNPVTELLSKYGWKLLPLLSYSLNIEPPDFTLFPAYVGRAYAWRTFSLSRKALYSGFQSHLRTEQK